MMLWIEILNSSAVILLLLSISITYTVYENNEQNEIQSKLVSPYTMYKQQMIFICSSRNNISCKQVIYIYTQSHHKFGRLCLVPI